MYSFFHNPLPQLLHHFLLCRTRFPGRLDEHDAAHANVSVGIAPARRDARKPKSPRRPKTDCARGALIDFQEPKDYNEGVRRRTLLARAATTPRGRAGVTLSTKFQLVLAFPILLRQNYSCGRTSFRVISTSATTNSVARRLSPASRCADREVSDSHRHKSRHAGDVDLPPGAALSE